MLVKINKLKNWQVALIITALGFVVFFTGLTTPFQGDDITQIVGAVPVHSITNIRLFFEGSTFYNGQGIAPLTGLYFRPLQTTLYSLIYTVFGSHSLAFHLIQLILCVACAFILYLVLRYFFNAVLSLLLAIIFLVHPLNSQIAYAIPQLDDVLFLFFGILAIWFLLRFKTIKSLWLVALFLFLSLLSKETAVVFVVMALLYLFWFNRSRLFKFIYIVVLPTAAYLAIRINAIGLINHPTTSPIDNLNLVSRLYSAPSIMLLYLTKFIFPWKLATNYFWSYSSFSFRHVLLPLIIDLVIIAIVVYLAFVIRTKASKKYYFSYLFFAIWAFLGILTYLQIIPLDQTASEPWFYFSMVGWLGMIGVVLVTFQSHIRPKWFLIIAALIIGIFGVRTALRGLDWRSPISLAYKDISVSKDDYVAYTSLSGYLLEQDKYSEAEIYAAQSIKIFPTDINYNNLGYALGGLGNYSGAFIAYDNGLKYGNLNPLYENIGELTLVYGNRNSDKQFLLNALQLFPKDSKLWMYLAIIEESENNYSDAKNAITNATAYGQIPKVTYNSIMYTQPSMLNVSNLGKTIYIQ